jgi:hypothetical protein
MYNYDHAFIPSLPYDPVALVLVNIIRTNEARNLHFLKSRQLRIVIGLEVTKQGVKGFFMMIRSL